MRFARQVAKLAARKGGLSPYSVWKSAAFRLRNQNARKAQSLWDHVRFLIRLWLVAALVPFRIRRRPQVQVILHQCPFELAQRAYFFKKYAPAQGQIVAPDPNTLVGPIYVRKFGPKQVRLLFQGQWFLFRLALVSFLRKSSGDPSWKIRFANLFLQQILFSEPGTDQMVFLSFEPETYLSGLAASVFEPGYHPKIASSNSVLFSDNRYLFLPKGDFILCSRVQVPEVECYRKLGWTQIRTWSLWGLEEADQLDAVPITPPEFDIAIYSSGFWARNATGWRITDQEVLRKGGNPENPWYKVLLDIFQTVLELRREFPDLKVKVFPHPFEVSLFQNQGISPPYFPLVLAAGFDLQTQQRNSLSTLYQARIGIASQSTIIFDRIHLGLESYFYSGKQEWTSIEPRFLGEFAQLGFQNKEELKTILNKALQKPSA